VSDTISACSNAIYDGFDGFAMFFKSSAKAMIALLTMREAADRGGLFN
jgi:hypothetical protein